MDGIAWNEDVTGPVTTVTQLLEDPELKGKVGVWNSMGDTLGLVMLENGDDPAKVTDEAFDRALAVIQRRVDSGQIRRFYGNDYAQPLATGDLAASMAWSGDMLTSGRQPEAQVGDPREGRDHLDRQHADPARRQRADGLDVHELRLRPEDRGAARPRARATSRRSRA